MPQAHFDTQILNYHIVTPPVKGLQRCWQGLSHSPSHSKTSIAWMLTWLAAANVVLFHWLSTHAIGSQSNGNALQRLGVRPYRFHPRQGWRFVSCAPVIAALLFGCSANAASLQTDETLVKNSHSPCCHSVRLPLLHELRPHERELQLQER